MEPEVFRLIKELEDNYPQIQKALANYALSMDAYNKAMASIESTAFRQMSTYALTDKVRYNANFSKPTG